MKIAICTPHYRDVSAKFMLSLMSMISHTSAQQFVVNGVKTPPQIHFFTRAGSSISSQRNLLTRDAILWEANYLFWLDSDHVFPPDILVRLLAHNLAVVGANQPTRSSPTGPTASDLDGELVWTTLEKAQAGSVERIARLGLAVLLMDMNVLGTLDQQAKVEGRTSTFPLFSERAVPNDLIPVGEDYFFFDLLERAGVPTYVDHAVSWDVGHIHEIVLTNADTVAQKDAYLESTARRSAVRR